MSGSYPNVDLHFKLLDKIKSAKDSETKKRLCIQDVKLFPKFKREWLKQARELIKSLKESDKLTNKKHLPGYYSRKLSEQSRIPNYPAFKALAIIYEKEGDYKSAIKVCKDAIRTGQANDGTQGGMRERIKKLEAKI